MKAFWIVIWLVIAVELGIAALLVPAHLRAVDASIVEAASTRPSGANAPTLLEASLTFLSTEKLGPARFLWMAAENESLPRSDELGTLLSQYSRNNPAQVALGGASPVLDTLSLDDRSATVPSPIIEILARRAARETVRLHLQTSRRPGVQQTLLNRNLTNTIHFPAATTAAGQPLEAAILLAALLNQGDFLTPTFREAFEWLALRANQGDPTESLELVYLDLLSLGRRLDWTSLAELMKHIDTLATLRECAQACRTHQDALVTLYAATLLSERPLKVARYLSQFPKTGVNDLNFALRFGSQAVTLLVDRQQRVYYAGFRDRVTGYDPFYSVFAGLRPAALATQFGSLALKYLLFLLAGLCLARGLSLLASAPGPRSGLRLAADGVFAFALTFVVGIAIEPFVGLPEQRTQFPALFQLPSLANAAGLKLPPIPPYYMNQVTLASLVFFFVVQATIYIFCLLKLAEIRRQPVGCRMKLKLIENEDLLFDAGLYVGFVGSVLSLILMSLGLGKVSMMAYASTSFGIIFVSVLKIFHVRPFRRQLILESDTEGGPLDQASLDNTPTAIAGPGH